MSDKFYDLYFELQEIYMLAADADSTNWQEYCDIIRKKVFKLLDYEKNNNSQ